MKIFDYDARGIKIETKKSPSGQEYGHIFFLGRDADKEALVEELAEAAPTWQLERASNPEREVTRLTADHGPVWLVQALPQSSQGHQGALDKAPYGEARDLMGAMAIRLRVHELKEVLVEFVDASDEEKLGCLVGLEMASYRYRSIKQPKEHPDNDPRYFVQGVTAAQVKEAAAIGTGVNVARHLVNTPPGELNPTTYAREVKKLFQSNKQVTVEVWSGARLTKEKMELLKAVGAASDNGPCMIHIKYRPSGKKNKKPFAFVGKGVTFDSGGLDIKPAAGMRWMKKDMGGSASLVGFAQWLQASGVKAACDVYLAVAENSIDANAFRPSDVIKARNGLTVEIHNTDAEGRLVLADVLDVAASKKAAEAPEFIVDLATLTGAMRVGLGLKVAGLFSNNDDLANAVMAGGHRRSDIMWRMPLLMDFKASLKSTFADLSNAANTPFGGAISAAVFLAHFIKGLPWVHVDMMSWVDRGGGAFSEAGGNGQCVQALAAFVEERIS